MLSSKYSSDGSRFNIYRLYANSSPFMWQTWASNEFEIWYSEPYSTLAVEEQLHSFARAALIYVHTPDDLNDRYALSYGSSSWEADIMVSTGVAPFQGSGGEWSGPGSLLGFCMTFTLYCFTSSVCIPVGKYPFVIRMLFLLDWGSSQWAHFDSHVQIAQI